jgi:hypothetical protein
MMQFYRHADGSVTVDSWDDEIMISFELLDEADPALLRRTDSGVEILGRYYEYRWTDFDNGYEVFRR